MNDFYILHQLLKEHAMIPLNQEKKNFSVELREPQANHKPVTITGIPENTVVIKVDKFPEPSAIYQGKKGECKRADFLIISEKNDNIYLIYIELKKVKGSKKEIIQQFKGAQCFLAHMREVGKLFWDNKDFLKNYEQRFISINHIGKNKNPSRIERNPGNHDTPEKMMKIGYKGNLFFDHIKGR